MPEMPEQAPAVYECSIEMFYWSLQLRLFAAVQQAVFKELTG